MNIKSFIKSFTFEKAVSVQNEDAKPTSTAPVSSKGIASVPDFFEASRGNFFSGKQLDVDSLQQEQDYSKGTFDPAKGYTGVIQQEGRVQLDADSSESTDVKSEFLRDSAFTSFKDDDD
jgi:Family of unknown function (DUF6519)